MKHLLFSFLLLFPIVHVSAQEYATTSIPENLKKDAYAVVRYLKESFKQDDLNNGVYKVTYVITILEGKGRELADFFLPEDTFRELRKFSGEIMNASGKTVKKIAKKDLITTAYSSHLATDNKKTFYECYASGYPFTVKYEFEMKYKNGILMYPAFNPVASSHLAIQHAEYSLQIPANIHLRYKLHAGMPEPQKEAQEKDSVFHWKLSDFQALPYERFAPYNELLPYALLSPADFCVSGVCGDMSSWESFGKWSQKLLEGRQQLPPAVIAKVTELVKDIPREEEKVKRIYEYLQSTTHYVSLQLGIGGWQPMPAAEVAKTGFGDCKALSNYMKAMLAAVNIPSYYTIISTEKERFLRDYPNFAQANHVILMVPLKKDTLWLECTSQILPFGYIHSSIMGHDALAVGDDRIFFCTLPSYAGNENKAVNSVHVRLTEDGHADMQIHSTYALQQYEELLSELQGVSNKEELELLGELMRVHKPLVKNIKKKEYKNPRPSLELSYSLQCEDFASKTGSRLFAAYNPARTSLRGMFTGNTRVFDIKLPEGMCQLDTISIQIPEGYTLESKPKPAKIISDYGSFESAVEQDANTVTYMQRVEINRGVYPAAKYDEMKQFFEKVESLQSGNIGFRRKQ